MVARAIRAVIIETKVSCEVFNLDRVRADMEDMCSCLSAPPPVSDACYRCGKPLGGQIQLAVSDIDQAFEACSASTVLPCWAKICSVFSSLGHCHVLVRKGRKTITSVSKKGFSSGWLLFDATAMTRSLLATTLISFGCLGDLVYRCAGLPIGGVMSMVAVAIVLALQDMFFDSRWDLRESNDFFRGVLASAVHRQETISR